MAIEITDIESGHPLHQALAMLNKWLFTLQTVFVVT